MATMMKTPHRKLHDYISRVSERADVRVGSPVPLGTQERGGGVNFAIFSRNASRVRLELFDHPEDAVPARVIDLDSARNRTGHYKDYTGTGNTINANHPVVRDHILAALR
jgi:isoamylase